MKLLSYTLRLLSIFTFLGFCELTLAFGDDEFELNASIQPVEGASLSIIDLKWKSLTPKLKLQTYQNKDQLVAILRGNFKKEGWTLYCNSIEIHPTRKGNFRLPILLSGKHTPILIQIKSQKGKTFKDQFIVLFNDWEPNLATKLRSIQKTPVIPFGLSPSAGIAYISYQQTGVKNFSELSVITKLAWSRTLSKEWNLVVNSFFSAFPFNMSQTGTKAYFLGFNSRIGYLLPSFHPSLQVLIMGGYYYSTMFVTSNSFGYNNISGPQLFPSAKWTLSSGNTIGGYLKFSPVVSDFSILTLENRELAAGFSHSQLLQNGHFFSTFFDFSQLTLLGSQFTIQSTSLSLSIGYDF